MTKTSRSRLVVYNSLTRRKEPFVPLTPGKVLMYVCGPTVYDLSHIGHARSAVAFDVVYRYLKYSGFEVRYARNYTDVDDKIIARANEEGMDPSELAERNIEAFDADMAALGVRLPTLRPRATETMDAIIELTSRLIDRGFAYVSGGDVFFSVRAFKGYGSLSGKKIDELDPGSRVDVNESKRDPLDFALWKASKPYEPSWESPWGAGRPGWHIECTAMIFAHLGESIDIHGGGKDLIFPHHENEIAQAEAATGATYVKTWMHNGFVNIDKEKMSKSLGNILSIRDALTDHTPEAVRLFLLSSHYRSPIDYSQDSLKESEAALERVYKTLERMERQWPDVMAAEPDTEIFEARFSTVRNAMDDDFNTADAIGVIFREIKLANQLMDRCARTGADEELTLVLPAIAALAREAGRFLGLFTREPGEYYDERRRRAGVDAQEVERLIKERAGARGNRDFKRADEIRAALSDMGVVLEDTADGTTWSVKE